MAIPHDPTAIDLEEALSTVPGDLSPDTQVWCLLCAQTLSEVDPVLGSIRAQDIAARLAVTDGYREQAADAAAFLWLARMKGESQPVEGH